MPRGGARPNSGPPKGTKYRKRGTVKKKKPAKKKAVPSVADLPDDILAEAKESNLSPLDYMLKVINDPAATADRKDRLAQAAAPYVHPRADSSRGKKEEKQEAAKKASTGRFRSSGPPLLKAVK